MLRVNGSRGSPVACGAVLSCAPPGIGRVSPAAPARALRIRCCAAPSRSGAPMRTSTVPAHRCVPPAGRTGVVGAFDAAAGTRAWHPPRGGGRFAHRARLRRRAGDVCTAAPRGPAHSTRGGGADRAPVPPTPAATTALTGPAPSPVTDEANDAPAKRRGRPQREEPLLRNTTASTTPRCSAGGAGLTSTRPLGHQ